MASIEIKITEEEKLLVIKAIKKLAGSTISVAKIASEAHLNPNRTRFIVEDLIEEERIERHVVKAYNDKYIRYTYVIGGKK
jgi:hypothetical protein